MLDTAPLFEYPLADATARSLIVNPAMKQYAFKEPEDVTNALEGYPLRSLIFVEAYEAMAAHFHSHMTYRWQKGIESDIKNLLRKSFGGLRQLDLIASPTKIDPRLAKFYN